jgi:hypothetical protein
MHVSTGWCWLDAANAGLMHSIGCIKGMFTKAGTTWLAMPLPSWRCK